MKHHDIAPEILRSPRLGTLNHLPAEILLRILQNLYVSDIKSFMKVNPETERAAKAALNLLQVFRPGTIDDLRFFLENTTSESQLRELDLSRKTELPESKQFIFDGVNIGGFIGDISQDKYPALRSINLSNQTTLSDIGLKNITTERFRNITSLNLSGCTRISSRDVMDMFNRLSNHYENNSKISSKTVLEYLNMHGCNASITQRIIEYLCKNMPNTTIVDRTGVKHEPALKPVSFVDREAEKALGRKVSNF